MNKILSVGTSVPDNKHKQGDILEFMQRVYAMDDENRRKIKYLYETKGKYWFCEEKDPGKRFELDAEQVGEQIHFVKQNTVVDLISFQEKIIGVEVPIKVELKVTEAAPAVKGNTVQGGLKQVTVETGFTVNVPMFVNEGDILRINTDTGEYVERVN